MGEIQNSRPLMENINLEYGIPSDDIENSSSESHKNFLFKVHCTYHLDPLPKDPEESRN